MSDIKIIKKNGKNYVSVKSGLPDIPKPHTIILKTTVQNEFETIAITTEQYERILAELEKGASGIILNGEYTDKWDIKKVK